MEETNSIKTNYLREKGVQVPFAPRTTASLVLDLSRNQNLDTTLNEIFEKCDNVLSTKEDKTNKVTSLSSSSTDVQYPSAKAVYTNVNELSNTTLKKGAQTLSSSEKEQVRNNIDVYGKSETYTKTEVNGLVDTSHQNYITVATFASLPTTGSEDTIYRVSSYNGSTNQVDVTVYSEYAWDGTQYIFLCVKSQIGEVFDITLYNNNTKYADLAAALGANGVNVPEGLRKGGMSVKFVQSSDNKYVQCRLMSDTWSINTEDWAIADEGVYAENPEYVYVKTDAEGKILLAFRTDGSIYFGAGCPPQVKKYVLQQINALGIEALLATKVDKVLGKSLIDEDFASAQKVKENTEWIDVTTDAEGRMLRGRDNNGTVKEFISLEVPKLKAKEATLGDVTFSDGIPEQIKDYVDDNPEIKRIPADFLQLSKQADNLIDVIGFSSFVGKTFVIVSPDRYSSWPFVGKLGNKLICLYSVGEQHEAQEGAIWVTESTNGVVWTPKRLIIDDVTIRDNVTGIGNDSNGNIIFWVRVGFVSAGTHYDLYRTSDGYSFERISQPTFDVIVQPTSIFTVPTQGLFSFYHVYGSSGSWGCLKSSNNGFTWTKQVIESSLAIEECPKEIYGAYLGDGKILAVGRYEGSGTGKLWQIQSDDYGATWTKNATNINNKGNTPSIIYDDATGKISLYIYDRSNGTLGYREADIADVWDNPTNWPSATAIATGAGGQNAGNVTTCVFNGKQIASWYSGNSQDTGIYCIIN